MIGNVIDGTTGKAVPSITVSLQLFSDSMVNRLTVTDKNGGFEVERIPFGTYRIIFSGVGYGNVSIDSIVIRSERYDFNLGDIKLSPKAGELNEVIVYAEKPLIENKEGKITFNVGESALSAGSSTTELLRNMPLITNDAEGKILLKGKEPKILIDDKPTDLNAQQLADLLESLPGSSIEKIELMTNPPPQYANETGGVINIITRKGKIGLTGRVTASYGTRGEGNLSANASYRNQKVSASFYAGIGVNRLNGGGTSYRNNFYTDSSNSFQTTNHFTNENLRPNLRFSVDYEINKRNSVNLTTQFASNIFTNNNETQYINLNNSKKPYRISNRFTNTTGDNINPGISLQYVLKGKRPAEILRVNAGFNYGVSQSRRNYFQQFLTGDLIPMGIDSTQRQLSDNVSNGVEIRVNYDKPVKWMKSTLSLGSTLNKNNFGYVQHTDFLRKTDQAFVNDALLSNDFNFLQTVAGIRAGITIDLTRQWKLTGSSKAEFTEIDFQFHTATPDTKNQYLNMLPNIVLRKDWKKEWNASLLYRRSIRRPGIDELNPGINYTDPYNLRFGNPLLLPQIADNYDMNIGTYQGKFYGNLSIGFNKVKDIIQRIRTLIPDGKTQITYNNITDRKEYETSIWGGYSFSRQFRLNASAGYTFNEYSEYDRTFNRYRNGGSFYTSLNYNFILTDRVSFDGNLRYNSFADPQGRSRSNLSQNIGVQTKYLNKRLVLSINLIDLFAQQQFTNFVYGSNFTLQSVSNSNSRNVRMAVSYNLKKNRSVISNKQRKQLLENIKLKGQPQ